MGLQRVGHHWATFTSLHFTSMISSVLGEQFEKAMAPHSSTLVGKTLWMKEPGRLQSMGFQRVRHDWVTELIDWLKITADGDWSHEIRRCLLLRRKPIANLVKMKVKFTQLCQTLCDPMDCSTPGFPVHHQLQELTRTYVQQVSYAIQSSHPLSSPSPPTFNLSQHQGLFQWVGS